MSDLIKDIIRRETGGDPDGGYTNDPDDPGGRTQFGISERAHPEAWADDKVTLDEATGIYDKKYIDQPDFDLIKNIHLQHQLVDMGVPSGPQTAIRTLQQLVGVTVDGVIGPKTLAAIERYPAGLLFGYPVPGIVLLNLAVRDARILLYIGIVKRNVRKLKFLLGWVKRALEFK